MNFDPSAFVGDQALVGTLLERARAIDCSHDRVLFCQGDVPSGIYVVLNGEVTLVMESLSKEILISVPAEPGSLLGLPGLVGNCPYSLSAYAKRGSHVSFVSREDFSALMMSEPTLSMMILKVLASEVRSARVAMAG